MWGWVRLCFGLAQIWLATAGFGLLLVAGLLPITFVLVIAASAATVISRVLYRGRGASRPGKRGSYERSNEDSVSLHR